MARMPPLTAQTIGTHIRNYEKYGKHIYIFIHKKYILMVWHFPLDVWQVMTVFMIAIFLMSHVMMGYLEMIEKVIAISIMKSRKTLFLYGKKEILFLIRKL